MALARRYAGTKPAMIVLGGSSMHKGGNGWQAARAVSCLPALTGNVGIAGGGLGPRHGSAAHGRGLANLVPSRRASLTGDAVDDMASIGQALRAGRIRNLLLFGTNMLSSFADADALAHGLAATRLIVSHDLFMNDTARRFADVVLPSTAWLEELGCKATNTHLYLMEPALPAAGQTRSANQVLRDLAARVGLTDFDPWGSDEATIDAILAHPCSGHATVAALRAEGGMRAMNVSHIAHPDLRFATPSGRLEFFSTRAQELGLPPLPVAEDACPVPRSYPLALAQGRTLNQFHAFYDHGRALPTLARKEAAPQLWIAPQDAATRGITHGALVRVFNERGEFEVAAHVTDRIPAGTLWLRDGWPGLNRITGGAAVLPAAAVDAFAFSAGQARFDAAVEVRAVS